MTSSWPIGALSALGQGFLFPASKVIAQPAGGLLTSSDIGKLFLNTGASALSSFTLPDPSGDSTALGWMIGFCVIDTDGIKVTADGGALISVEGSNSAANGFAQSITIGSALVLVLVTTGRWVALMGNNRAAWTVT